MSALHTPDNCCTPTPCTKEGGKGIESDSYKKQHRTVRLEGFLNRFKVHLPLREDQHHGVDEKLSEKTGYDEN